VLAGYTQLRLACQLVGDQCLPWERPRPPGQLSPTGCGGGFRDFWPYWVRRLLRRNPRGAPQAGPRAAAPGPATRDPAIKKPPNKQPTAAKAA
jgi:hypothetical protein